MNADDLRSSVRAQANASYPFWRLQAAGIWAARKVQEGISKQAPRQLIQQQCCSATRGKKHLQSVIKYDLIAFNS